MKLLRVIGLAHLSCSKLSLSSELPIIHTSIPKFWRHYVYVCMYIGYVYVSMHVCVFVCVCMCVCVCVHVCLHMHTCVHMCLHVCIHVATYIGICIT